MNATKREFNKILRDWKDLSTNDIQVAERYRKLCGILGYDSTEVEKDIAEAIDARNWYRRYISGEFAQKGKK